MKKKNGEVLDWMRKDVMLRNVGDPIVGNIWDC